jgi:hypothetical protein
LRRNDNALVAARALDLPTGQGGLTFNVLPAVDTGELEAGFHSVLRFCVFPGQTGRLSGHFPYDFRCVTNAGRFFRILFPLPGFTSFFQLFPDFHTPFA